MSDYISREALLNSKCMLVVYSRNEDIVDYGVSFDTIKAIPAADVAPVVQGRWIERTDGGEGLVCKNCRAGYTVYDETPFCPNCGARMDDEKSRV